MAQPSTPATPSPDQIHQTVRERYAEFATTARTGASCCAPDEREAFGPGLYEPAERATIPEEAVRASLGCGNPTAVADLSPGEIVLDLGSGGGIDVLLSAGRVGPDGLAYGLDMTDEMLDLARRTAAEAGVTNVAWLKGIIEEIPLPDGAVDVVISNCVINLAPDKLAALRETARVLRPGGRFAVSDVVADSDIDEAVRADMDQWTGCVAGALTREQYIALLEQAGLVDVEVIQTHRVHACGGSAIIRARKPALPAPG